MRVKKKGTLLANRVRMIANQMMKGLIGKQPPPDQVVAFLNRFKEVVEWVDKNTPRVSVGVLGAIGKAVLWYGKDKIQPFCDALKKGDFQGQGDPAHILYLSLYGRVKYNTKESYSRTVATIRLYCAGKQMKRIRDGIDVKPYITPASTDLFEWNEDYTAMKRRHCNYSKTEVKTIESE